MTYRWPVLAAALALMGAVATGPVPGPELAVTGHIDHYPAFASGFVAPRNVDVWLPPDYGRDPARRYPVVYMQDGQNLFDPATSYGGIDWAIDETMTELIADRRIRSAIVVGIWNTAKRAAEYMPQKAHWTNTSGNGSGIPSDPGLRPSEVVSDAYLRFLVQELKPFVDQHYRTLPDRADTFVMGSSMGGLVSAYAVSEYPAVFGGAACVSTHWPAGDGAVISYLAAHLPDPATHRFYFDHGTNTLDAGYAPYQQRMDAVMRKAGYVEGVNWVTKTFPGAEHSEKSWRLRAAIPLEFLLGR